MYSVTKRISMINQPHGGYLNKKNLTPIQLQDTMLLNDNENIHASLVGLVVDYMTYSKKDGKMVFKENTSLKSKELYIETHKRIEDLKKSER